MDYETYWRIILGDRSPEQVADEFDLTWNGRRDLDEWVGHNVAEAHRQGGQLLDADGDPIPGTEGYHDRAVDAAHLCAPLHHLPARQGMTREPGYTARSP